MHGHSARPNRRHDSVACQAHGFTVTLKQRSVGHDQLNFDARDAARSAGDTFHEGIGHYLAAGSCVPTRAEGVGVAGKGCVHCHTLRDGQKGSEISHSVRCRAQADSPLRCCMAGPLADRTRITAIGSGPCRRYNCLVARSNECPGICGEFLIHCTSVFGAQTRRLLHQQGGPPFVQLATVQGGQSVRHFRHQCFGQTQQAATTGRGFPPGEGNLGADALALLVGREPLFGLLPAFEAIKGHRKPRLLATDRRLQVFKAAHLIDQTGAIGGQSSGSCGRNQATHGRIPGSNAGWPCHPTGFCFLSAFHNQSLPSTTDIIGAVIGKSCMTPCSKVSYFYFSLVTTVLLFLPAALGCLLLAVIALFKLPVMILVMLFFAMVFGLVVVQGYFNVTQEWRGRKARKLKGLPKPWVTVHDDHAYEWFLQHPANIPMTLENLPDSGILREQAQLNSGGGDA